MVEMVFADGPGEAPDLVASAKALHAALADPDSAPGNVKRWHAAFDAMRDDHKQNMEIGGEPDWPSTLLAALLAFASESGDYAPEKPSRGDDLWTSET